MIFVNEHRVARSLCVRALMRHKIQEDEVCQP
jgi:hypothetical protein